MRILVLDDDEVRHEQFAANLTEHSVVHVRTTEEAGNALSQEKFDVVYLDHDLNDFARNPGGYGQVEQTGFDVARFIARYLAPQKRPELVVVHSWNSAGARRMVAELQEAGVPVRYEPFNGKSGAGQTQAPPTDTRPWVSLGSLADLKESTEGVPDFYVGTNKTPVEDGVIRWDKTEFTPSRKESTEEEPLPEFDIDFEEES